jgi:hypothetical protein
MGKREERVDNSPLLPSYLRQIIPTYTRMGVGISPHHHYTSWNVGITICPF